ncbi:hypothetical protein QYE47_23255 [Pseudomonas sp. 2,4-D]|uniref:hypothetical protein n=1 Tax=Pseudomonas sp. 2,4-D TaxID=3058433 RepID=UPI002636ABBC|nr:hypothetical protein [Pseudomonas sp. 2,4-D]MDN4515443.1 hypothetical protein [Pseudomonas sp. 2,4-D]
MSSLYHGTTQLQVKAPSEQEQLARATTQAEAKELFGAAIVGLMKALQAGGIDVNRYRAGRDRWEEALLQRFRELEEAPR